VAFVRSPGGKVASFEAPGAGHKTNEGTFAVSINKSGAVTGFYVDRNYLLHGFVRTQ
jgi:hypothetical protein